MERRHARRAPRTPEEKAEYELANIKRLYRNMVYGGLIILFLFLVNVLSAGTEMWFLWPAVAVALVLVLQAVRTLGTDGGADSVSSGFRRCRTWLADRRELAERSEAELAQRMRRQDEDERAVRRRIYRMRGFQRCVSVSGVVVAVLFVVNLMSSPGDWWVVWPMLGLGFVLAINAVQVYGVDGLLGPDWEDRKRQELRSRFEREAQPR
jgi:protein-S-isoprenylcysteine O-methyltransferase Ste14